MLLFSGLAPLSAATFSWNQGDGTWDAVGLKWAPLVGGPPSVGDDALLGDLPVAANATVTLGLNTPALNLLSLSGGVDLLTAGFDAEAVEVEVAGSGTRLVAEAFSRVENNDGATTVSDDGQLLVEASGDYDAGDLLLKGGGNARLEGGTLQLRKNTGTALLQINARGSLTGWGTVEFRDAGVITGPLLDNRGSIATGRPFPDFGQRQELVIDTTHPGEGNALLDLDGTTEDGTVSLTGTTTLSIVGTLRDDFSGTIDFSPGAVLDVSQPWAIDSGGSITVDAVQLPLTSTFARIEGAGLTARTGSTIDILSGRLIVEADFTADAGSAVTVEDNATLEFGGQTTINRADVIELGHDATTLVIGGSTTIRDTAGLFDWDGLGGESNHASTEVGEGASLVIDVGRINGGAEPMRYEGTLTIEGGSVDVRVGNDDSTAWTIARRLDMSNVNSSEAVLSGNPVVIGDGGVLHGHGRITSNSLNNSGVIDAADGTLVIDTVNASQLDGGAPNDGQGELRAVAGDLEVASNLQTTFNGRLVVGAGRTFRMTQPGSRFRNASASEDADGSGDFGRVVLGQGTIDVDIFENAGQIDVGSGVSTLRAGTIVLEDGSLIDLALSSNVLTLVGDTEVEPSASITGAGVLENANGSVLTALDGASIGVELRNGGRLQIGASAGAATVLDYRQTSSGTLAIELAGSVPGLEYDLLQLDPASGTAELDGTLDVSLLGGFAPSVGDIFTIIEAPGGVVGRFAAESLPSLPDGAFFYVQYGADQVDLEVLLTGDMDCDGDVDFDDIEGFVLGLNDPAAYEAQTGLPPEVKGDTDGDGDIDFDDIDLFVAILSRSAVTGMAGVPEPASAVLLALGAAIAVLGRRTPAYRNR